MEETELLEALDRRARRAVDALDADLESAVPPPLPASPEHRRTWTPLLIAAALVLVALVGAGLVLLDGGDERGTVADDRLPVESGDGLTRLALADPGEHGYTVRAAFDGAETLGAVEPGPFGLQRMVHVADGADPAVAPLVMTFSTPAGMPPVEGELVDIGVPGAVLRELGAQVSVMWPVGDEVRHLTSMHLRAGDLVEIAGAAVAAGWEGGAGLPGHRLLHQGPVPELSPTLAYPSPDGSGRPGIAYDRPGTDEDFVIGWSIGADPQARWLARRASAAETRTFEVRGQPATYHRVQPGAEGELSWLEPDGTLVEVVLRGDPDALLEVLDTGLAPISPEAHRRLVSRHPPAADQPLLDVPEAQYEPIGEGPVAAELRAERAGARIRVAIVEHPAHGLQLVTEVESDSGGGGSGQPLRDLRTPALQITWMDEPGEGFAIGGVVPPGVDVERLTVTDLATGTRLAPVEVAVRDIEGSDHQLLVVVIEGGPVDAHLDLTLPTPGGTRTWRW